MAGGKKKPNRRPPPKGPAKPAAPAGKAAAPAPATPPPPKRTQAQRLEDARRARARKSRNIRLAVVGAVVVVIGLLVLNTLDNRRDADALVERLEAGGCTFDNRSDPTSAGASNHVPPASYEVDPPAGGNHDPAPAPAGTYSEGNLPTDTMIVHSLEHGYIAIWHQPGLDQAGMEAIGEAVDGYERDVLVVPRPSVPGQVAATAWGERLLCPTAEAGALREFIEAYRNKGPEAIEHPPI